MDSAENILFEQLRDAVEKEPVVKESEASRSKSTPK